MHKKVLPKMKGEIRCALGNTDVCKCEIREPNQKESFRHLSAPGLVSWRLATYIKILDSYIFHLVNQTLEKAEASFQKNRIKHNENG